jgi:branched-chain amino acid transport system substrate-binding protein
LTQDEVRVSELVAPDGRLIHGLQLVFARGRAENRSWSLKGGEMQSAGHLSARRTLCTGALLAGLLPGVVACGSSSSKLSGPAIKGGTLTIYSSLPLQGASAAQSEAIVNGARLALSEAGSKIGNYHVSYVSTDDSTAAAGAADKAAIARNARRAASDPSTIAYIGEFNSGATETSLPILNRAGVAQVSPSNTYVGLTTSNPGSKPGEPDRYYPSGARTFARIVPTDDVQGAALARAASDADCRTVEIWNSGTPYSAGLARNVELAAEKLVSSRHGPVGSRAPAPAHVLKIAANRRIDPRAADYNTQARQLSAKCFIYTGEIESNAAQIYKDVATAHPDIKMFGGDAVVANAIASPTTGLPTSIAADWRGTFPTVAPSQLGSAAKNFLTKFEHTYNTANPDPYAAYGYEAMAVTLDAIKRTANGHKGQVSRRDVVNALLRTHHRHSAVGTYSMTSDGDTTLSSYGLYRIVGGRLSFDKVIETTRR